MRESCLIASVQELRGGGAAHFTLQPLAGARFGGVVRFADPSDLAATVGALEADPDSLPTALCESQGLLVLPTMHGITR